MSYTLEELKNKMNNCTACSLYKNGKLVEARLGNNAKVNQIELMVVGEAPDKTASEVGIPFQGPLGELLDQWLKTLCPSGNFVIVNVMKHFPMKDYGDWRSPTKEEIIACFPFLEVQIDVYKPKKILCVGDVAFTTITKRDKNEFKDAVWNKKTYYYKGIKCHIYYHPGYIHAKPEFRWKEQIDALAAAIESD